MSRVLSRLAAIAAADPHERLGVVKTWTPKDWAVAVGFVVLGFVLSRILPVWLWGGIAVVGFMASLWVSSRNNRRRARPLPPEYRPPATGGSSS